jgi:hypothetical protein
MVLNLKEEFAVDTTDKICGPSGGYIGITLSIRLSMYLVSATPSKPLIGFL